MIGTVLVGAIIEGFAARMTRGPFRRAVTAPSSFVVVIPRLAAVAMPVMVEVPPVVLVPVAINCLVGSSVGL